MLTIRMICVLLLTATFLVIGGMTNPAQALMANHDCSFCHDLHGAPGFSLLNDTSVEVLCMSCHADGEGSTAAVDVHTGAHFPSNRITCLGCHDPHDYKPINANGNDGIRDPDQNLDLVLRTITVMPFPVTAVFTDIDYSDGSYDYADTSGDGVCQVCHTRTSRGMTPRMRNDGSGSGHQLGSNCMSCHPHSNGFDR